MESSTDTSKLVASLRSLEEAVKTYGFCIHEARCTIEKLSQELHDARQLNKDTLEAFCAND